MTVATQRAQPRPAKDRGGAEARERAALARRFRAVRAQSEDLCQPLAEEDYVVQSMPDASPTKWHLAHTTWFFENFVLAIADPDRPPVDSHYGFLFNSYYNAVGPRQPRAARGLLSRPTVAATYAYRAEIDRCVLAMLAELPSRRFRPLAPVLELGLHHEQQHQELILTDLKHLFAVNPLRPAYRAPATRHPTSPPAPRRFLEYAGGRCEIGHRDGRRGGFAFDNEGPRHQLLLQPFALADRLVTNDDYLAFIDDGGYRRPELWLADGWDAVQAQGWSAPLYWERRASEWWVMTLAGMQCLRAFEPVCHVSFYEADAYARWAGARLPSEAEWETVASSRTVAGNLLEQGRFHPAARWQFSGFRLARELM